MQKLIQRLEPRDQIVGFSYSFTKTLAEYLRKAIDSNQVFFDTESAIAQPDYHFEVNYIMVPVIEYMANQLKCDTRFGLSDGNQATLQNVCNLLRTAENFLDIFKK